MAHQLALGAILAFITLAAVDAAGVTKIAAISRQGSTAGAHRITVHGNGFADDEFNHGTKPDIGNKVELYSTSHTYPCGIHKDGCTETLLTCNTVPMAAGKYKLRVWVDGVAVTVPSTDACVYEAKASKTPSIKSVEPKTGETGTIVSLKGNIMTTKADSASSASSNGETRSFRRIYFGPYLCNVWTDETRETLYGIALDTETGKSGYIICKESDDKDLTKAVEFVDNKNISFIIEDMGRSSIEKQALWHNGKNGLSMFQSYAVITAISPNSGSKNGGTSVTLTGMDCYSRTTNEVFVGGAKSESAVCKDKNLVFTTPAKPPSVSKYIGNRGVQVDHWTGVTSVNDLADVLTLTSSDAGHATSWTDSTYYKHPSTDAANYVKLSFFFKPSYEAEYRFMVQSFGGAIVYFTNMTEGATSQRELVARVDTDTTSWWTQGQQVGKYLYLQQQGRYFVEVVHNRKDTDSWVRVAVQTKTSYYTEDQTSSVKQERQKVGITSTKRLEEQEVDVSAYEDDDAYTASEQELDTQSFTDEDDFVLSLFNVKTKWISAATLNAKSIQNALNAIPLFATYSNPVTVADGTANGKYNVKFEVDMGDIPILEGEKKNGVKFQAKLKTAGERGKKNVHLNFAGVLVPSFAFNADANTIKQKMELALGTRCPTEVTNNAGAEFIQGYESGSNDWSNAGTSVTEPQPFCGRRSSKNPQTFYYNKLGLSINTQQVCFAYLGTLPSISVYCDDGWLATSWETPGDKNKWKYNCYAMSKLKTDNGCKKFTELKFAERENQDEDFYLDEVTVMKDGQTTSESEEDLMSRRVVGALPGGNTVSDVSVEKTDSKIKFTFHPNNCSCNYPLIKPALYGDVANEDTITTKTYDIKPTSLTVTRKLAASCRVSGTFKLKHKNNVAEFKVDSTATSFETQLASLNIGTVKVDYADSCNNPSFTTTFVTMKGDQEEMTVDSKSLTGIDADVKVTTEVNGHTIHNPLHGDMAFLPSTSPEIVYFINGIPCRCKTDCSFTYSAAKTPSVTSVTQDGSNLLIVGTLFSTTAGENTVKLGTYSCAVLTQSATQITCTPDSSGRGGSDLPVSVHVKNLGTATSTATYKYQAKFTAMTPTSGPTSGGTSVAITGQNLYEKFTIMVGDKMAEVVSSDHGTVIFNTPKSDSTGTVAVTMKNTDNLSDMLTANSFTYDNSLAFTLTSVEPLEYNAMGGGTMTLKGNALGTSGSLMIGNKEATLTTHTETVAMATVPALSPGTYPVRFTKTGQTNPGTKDGKIPEITVPLVVNDHQPRKSGLFGGSQLTIKGKGFGSDTSKVEVLVGKTSCSIDDLTDTQITCTIDDTGETKKITNDGLKTGLGNGFAWEPAVTNLHVGDKAEWTWKGPSSENKYDLHQTSSVDSVDKTGFTSGTPTNTGTFVHQFTNTGDVHYYSAAAGTDENLSMRGKVVVTPKSDSAEALVVKLGSHKAPYSYSAGSFAQPTCQPAPDTCGSHVSDSETGNLVHFLECCTSKITDLTVTKATEDDVVGAIGERLGTKSCQVEVLVGDKTCTVTESTATKVSFKLNSSIVASVQNKLTVKVANHGYALKVDNRQLEKLALVKNIAPLEGSIAGDTHVTFSGSGFTAPATVQFGQQNAEIIDVNPTTITVKTKSVAKEETLEVKVYSNGVEAKCDICETKGFRMVGKPKAYEIKGLSKFGDAADTSITITGSGFGTDKSSVIVKFGSSVCDVTSVTDTEIACKISCMGPGRQNLWIGTTLGLAKFSDSMPTTIACENNIWGVSSSVISKGGGTPIVANGCAFHDGSKVAYNGWNLDVEYDAASPCQLRIYPPSETQSKPGSTADGAFDVTGMMTMTDAGTPLITKLEKSGDQVTVSGSFLGATDITAYLGRGGRKDGTWKTFNFKYNHFALSPSTSVTPTSTQLDFTLPKLPAGSYSAVLSVGNKGFTPVSSDKIQVALAVNSISPDTGSTSGGYTVTILGEGLYPAYATVTMQCSGTDFSCTVVKEDTTTYQSLKCKTAKFPGSVTTECTVKVDITDPADNSKLSHSSKTFTYDVNLSPTITKVEPHRGGTGGGTLITITGTKFGTDKTAVSVTIDGVACVVQTVTDTQTECLTGQHSGTVKSKVLLTKGTGGLANQDHSDFEYIDVWSSRFTWGNKDPPVDSDFVVVKDYTLLLDQNTAKLKMLLIQGGALIFDEKDVELSAENILIMDNGVLQVGTEENPFQHQAVISMYGGVRCVELPIYGCKALALRGGKLDLHGKPIKNTWTLLDQTADADTDVLKVQHDVSDWQVGDEVVIATTSHRHSQSQTEKRTIKAVDADTRTITVTENLKYKHLGVTERFGSGDNEVSFELRAEVGLLSRNVKFNGKGDPAWEETIEACPEGFNTGEFTTQTCFQGRFGEEIGSDQFGGHIIMHAPEAKTKPDGDDLVVGRFSNIELTYVGQAFRLGRYPIHFHLNGLMEKSYVRGCSIHKSFNRAINIHGVHNVTVERNVAYNIMGGAFFLEDGIETNNVYKYNLAVFIISSTSLLNDDITPAAYWVTNPFNTHHHNHAAGGTHFGFWYRMHAHPDGPSFSSNICPDRVPLQSFYNNTVHSMGWFGLWIFQNYFPTKGGSCTGSDWEVARFHRLITWNNEKGAEAVNTGAIQFDGFLSLNNEKAGLETKFVGASPQYPQEGAHGYLNCITVAKSQHLDADPRVGSNVGTLKGFVLGYGSGSIYDGNIFHGFDGTRNVAVAFTKIDGTCSVLCGGYEYNFKRTVFADENPHKVKMEWLHHAVIMDLDGSFTGIDENLRCVLPTMGTLPSGCIKNSSPAYKLDDSSQELSICSAANCGFHRWSFNNILPSSMEAKDVVIQVHGDSTRNTTGKYAKKRMTHKFGWLALLENGATYSFFFKDAAHMTNISYTGTFYGYGKDTDINIMCQKMDEKPDRFLVNGKVEKNFSTSALTKDSKPFDVHYDADAKELCYTIKGGGARRRRSLPSYSNDIAFNFETYKCPHPNCEWPDYSKLTILCEDGTKTKMYWSTAVWSNVRPSSCTANCNKKPGATDTITIPAGIWMVLDENVEVNKLVIEGTLEVKNDATTNIELKATYIHIKRGQLLCGCKTTAFKGKFTVTLKGDTKTDTMAVTNGPPAGSKVIMNNGILSLIGKDPGITWTNLEVTAAVGDTVLKLKEVVTWKAGDEIVIAGTGFIATAATETAEILSITVTNGKSVITLTKALKHRHLVETSVNPAYTVAAEVGLLTRDIKIIGQAYTNQEKDFFGARVLSSKLSMTVDGNDAVVAGVLQLHSVQFIRSGQLGYVESYDPRHSVAMVSAGRIHEDVFVKKCSFSYGYSPAVGVFSSPNVTVEDNVIYRCIGDCVRSDSEGTRLIGNMITDALFPGTVGGRTEKLFDFHGGVFTVKATLFVMKGNSISNSERCGYHGVPEYCGGTDKKDCTVMDANSWSNNVIHSSLNGICLLATDTGMSTTEGVWQYRNFTIYFCYDFGIYYHNVLSLEVRHVSLINCGSGIVTFVVGPNAVAHLCENKQVTIENSLIVGKLDAYSCVDDKVDHSIPLIQFSILGRGWRIGDVQGGMVGLVVPVFVQAGNNSPFKPFLNSMAYNAICGKSTVKGVTFAKFNGGLTCGNPVAVATPPTIDDAIHPLYIYESTLIDVAAKYMVYYSLPRKGKINPSDCVDMACDGHKMSLIIDDGTFTGGKGSGSIIPKSGTNHWNKQDGYGEGDFRIPKPAFYKDQASTQKLSADDIRDEIGIVRDSCTWIADWNAYNCSSSEYFLLSIENMDSDTETRRLSPLAMFGAKGNTKTVNLINGPQDHGWCAGYTCQKRLSSFLAPFKQGSEYTYDLYLTSTSPQKICFKILNSKDSDKMLLKTYYNFQQVLKVETKPMFTDSSKPQYIPAKNTETKNGKEKFIPLAKKNYPSHSDKCDTNFFERDTSMLWLLICGNRTVCVTVQHSVILKTNLEVVDIDDFFNSDQAVYNLAGFLGIPQDKIRTINPVSESQIIVKRSTTSTITVYFEIGNNPASTSQNYTYNDLVDLADKIINAIQTGNLSTALNVTVNSMAVSEVLPLDTDENWKTIAQSENFLEDLLIPESLEFVETIVPGSEGNAFTTQPILHFLDKHGSHVGLLGSAAKPWTVVASIRDGTGSNAAASLIGNTTIKFSSGYANFTGLGITHSGTGYVIDFKITYPDNAASFTIASAALSVPQRSLKVAVASSSDMVYLGSYHSIVLELHDQDTSVKVDDIAWSGMNWNVAIAKTAKSSYSGSFTGTKSGQISAVSGGLTISDLALDTIGSEVINITVTSDPAGYFLTTEHVMTVYSTQLQNVTMDTSKTLTVKVPGDFAVLGNKVFAAAYMNKMMTKHPEVKFSNPVVTEGSILITMTIEGNGTTLSEMVTTVCSEITSGSTFTYDGQSYSLSSSLKVDGSEYYGVQCEISQKTEKDDEKKGGQKKLGIIIGIILAVVTILLAIAAFLYWKLKVKPRTKTHKIGGGHAPVYLGTSAPVEDILWREDSFMSIKEKYLSDRQVPALSTRYHDPRNEKSGHFY